MKRTMMTLLVAASLAVTSLAAHSSQARADDAIGVNFSNLNRSAHIPVNYEPDYAVTAIFGPTTINPHDIFYYKVTITNYGASTAAINNVNLEALMLGELQPGYAPVQVSNGFQCQQQGERFVCDGGTLAAGQSATIGFPVHGSAAGQGSITAVVNYDRSVSEGDRTAYDNDYQEAFVTVTN
jgi:Domain of unknown function DUF11